MKTLLMLEHKRIVEIENTTEEKIHSTILLGFFLTRQNCEENIQLYLDQPGFKDYPEDFSM
jgi:hypothetical protein